MDHEKLLEHIQEFSPSDLQSLFSTVKKEEKAKQRKILSDISIKEYWAKRIYILVFVTIVFHVALTFGVGFGWLNFEDHQTFLHMVIGESFLQVIGMGVIVARHLFPYKNNES